MKKALLVAMCVLTLFCLCACQENVYSQMNNVLAANYAETKIEVQTDAGNGMLNSTFAVERQGDKSIVTYHIEKFAEISADKIPANYITVCEGVAEIVNGEVVSQTGDAPEGISLVDATKINFNFSESYFADVSQTEGVFNARVNFPKQFVGSSSLNCTNMQVTFDYGGAQKVLTVVYTDTNGALVSIVYTLK